MFPYQELQEVLYQDLQCHPRISNVSAEGLPLHHVRAEMLRRSFLKKLSPTSHPGPAAVDRALEKFKSINDRLPPPGEAFRLPENLDQRFYDIFDYFKDVFGRAIETEEFDLDSIGDELEVGPGSAVGADSRNFLTKLFHSKLTATSDELVKRFRAMISRTEAWATAEMRRFKAFGLDIIPGSRIFFVNKSVEIARTCATEANVNMLVQKGIGRVLERVLKRVFRISLQTQPDHNRVLARQGSINGLFGTIDLASASDSISLSLLRAICPPRLLSWILLSRSPVASVDGHFVEMKMVSTMGNGFTFPLQTLLFASAVRAIYTYHGLPCKCSQTEFGVFGDDIIVHRDVYDDVVTFLTLIGFQVNDDKSFNEGPFRESCGSDFYDGHLVRGVYIQSLETLQHRYSAINRLLRWSALSGIPLKGVIAFILKTSAARHYVPRIESDDAGIHVPEIFLAFIGRAKSPVHGLLSYRCFMPKAKKLEVKDSEKWLGATPSQDELLVTSLAGHLQTTDIVIKPFGDGFRISEPAHFLGEREMEFVRYRIAQRFVSSWDPSAQCVLRGKGPCDPLRFVSTEAWITSVVRHLIE